MTSVVGIDLSLTSTGIADDNGTHRICVKTKGPERLRDIRARIVDECTAWFPTLVVMEGYSYGSPNQAHQVGELGGVIRLALWEAGVRYAIIAPTTLKKFATGKGNSKKDAMIADAIRTFGFEGSNNDEADAWLLRCMGLAHLGVIGVSKARMAEVDKVDWPT